MAEEFDNQEENEDEGKSLWEILQREQQGESEEEEEHEEMQEEQDEEIAKQTKLERKFSSKMENMQKKFEETLLHERISKFEDGADELTLDMFKTVASDVKNLEDFDKAMSLVKKQAAKLREQAEKYRLQMEEEAGKQVAQAWGTGPIGTPSRRPKETEDEVRAKIEAGDTKTALAELLNGDRMVGNIF